MRERFVVTPDAVLAELAHLQQQRDRPRPARRHLELAPVHVEQVFPAARPIVDPPEASQRRDVLRIDRDHLAEPHERGVAVSHRVVEDLARAVQQGDDLPGVLGLLCLDLERLDELQPAPGALGRPLQRVDGAEMIGVEAEDAPIGVRGLQQLAERILEDRADLEEIGDRALGVGRPVDRTVVDLDQLAVLAERAVDARQRLERRGIARHEPERARMVLGGVVQAPELRLEDLRDARVGRGATARIIDGFRLGEVHSGERIPRRVAGVELPERLQRRDVGRLDRERLLVKSDRVRVDLQPLFVERAETVEQRDSVGRRLGRAGEPRQHHDQRIPALGGFVEPRELLEHEQIVRHLGRRTLERRHGLVAVSESLRVQAADAVERHRAHGLVLGLLRLTREHADEVAPPFLGVIEALQRRERAGRERIELERGLVQLDRGVRLTQALLDEASALHDERGAMPRVSGDRVGRALVRPRERCPRLARELALLERLQKRRIASVELERGRVGVAGLRSHSHHVLEQAPLGMEQGGLPVRR